MLSPADWRDVFFDQVRQVRRGTRRNGVWGVEVARAGFYEISLRRWPIEASLPIRAAAPEFRAVDGTFPAGVALPIAGARLEVGDLSETKAVTEDVQEITFRVRLDAGETRLRTSFTDANGDEICGAYYVYAIRR